METLSFESPFASVFAKIERQAHNDGAEVELLVERSEKFSVGFQKGRPEKFDSSTSHCAGLRVIWNGSEGIAYSENLGDEALLSAYGEALSNARFTAKADDPERRVKLWREQGGGVQTSSTPVLHDLFDPSIHELSMEEKLERGRQLEDVALQHDPRIASVPYTAYVESESETHILNSNGVRKSDRRTGVAGYTYTLARSGEENRMGAESSFTRYAREFNAEKVAKAAAEKAVAKLGAAPPETGVYPVVIDAEVMSEILSLISDYFSAKSVFEKSSLFMNDLGKSIASSKLHIVDDPFLKGGVASRAFDGEGATCRVTNLVVDGKLENFLTNSVYAERMKLPHTASASRGARSPLGIGISNMVVRPGAKTLAELLAAYPKVVYVTSFSGYHAGFNESSGDFSLQSEGELWENGKRVRPLCDFVVAGNIKTLLQDIEDLSSRVLPLTDSVVAPDALIRQLSVAGA